jgi:hypothetical protein
VRGLALSLFFLPALVWKRAVPAEGPTALVIGLLIFGNLVVAVLAEALHGMPFLSKALSLGSLLTAGILILTLMTRWLVSFFKKPTRSFLKP